MRKLKREEARTKKRDEVAKAREKGIYIRTPPTSSDSEEDIPIPAPLSLNGAADDTERIPEPIFVPAVRLSRQFDEEDTGSGSSEGRRQMTMGDLAVRGRCPHCLHDVDFDLQFSLKAPAMSE